MTSSRLAWLALILLGSAVSLLAILRSRRVPALRPVAVALVAFCELDAIHFAIAAIQEVHARALLAGLAPPPLPWWLGWADVAVFCGMAGAWAGLLVRRKA